MTTPTDPNTRADRPGDTPDGATDGASDSAPPTAAIGVVATGEAALADAKAAIDEAGTAAAGAVGAATRPPRETPQAVLDARAEVEATRAELVRSVAGVRASAREAVNPKTQLRKLASDPARLAKVAAGGAVVVAGVVGLRAATRRLRGGRIGTLPPEVESALAKLGSDGDDVRRALDASFTSYLGRYGATVPRKRLPSAVNAFMLPIAGVAAREVIRRYARRTGPDRQ